MDQQVLSGADALSADTGARGAAVTVSPGSPMFCFADGVALFVVGAGLFLLFLMWLLIALSAGVPGANWVVQCEYRPLMLGDGVLALTLWIVLRTGDLLLHAFGRAKLS